MIDLPQPLDEASRPLAPPVPAGSEHRRLGHRLTMIHRIHIQHLDEVRRAMSAVRLGKGDPIALRERIGSLDLLHTMRTFGTLCGQECYALNFHHSYEDANLFPALRSRGSQGLRAVIDRLSSEHRLIHQLVEALDDAAAALVRNPEINDFDTIALIFERLDSTVRSHFRYEETSIEAAMDYHGVSL